MALIRRIAVLAGFVAAGSSATTLAADAPPIEKVRAHLEISAFADCATVATVSARVAERSKRIVFVPAAADVPTLRGTIDRAAGPGVLAELTVVQPQGRRSRRQVAAPTCDQAADALALLVAMTLDPGSTQPEFAAAQEIFAPEGKVSAGATFAQGRTEPDGAAGRADTAMPEPAATRERGKAEMDAVPARRAGGEQAPSAVPIDAGATRAVLTGDAGAAGATMVGLAPSPMFGIGIFGTVAIDRPSLASPALRLSAAHLWRGGIAATGGTADFTLDVVALDLCGLRASVGNFAARACVRGRLGRLAAAGSRTYDRKSEARLFGSAGAAMLANLTLPASFELAAEAELGWALTRYEFAFSPQVFYRTRSIPWGLGLGLGRHFP